ncbi:UDP-N-acetylmuramate dehydrogenase [Candidatus Peregrinibacteria bacterium]|nr:UDP-N-acetylmuramate dehydrogenase [Candidatus Peregrinibacteria bacterium]
MKDVQSKFLEKFPRGKIDESLKRFTTFRIGGPSDLFYELEDPQHLPKLFKFVSENNLPYIVLGGGSNLLFHDKGFRGLVIKMNLKGLSHENTRVTAQSGVLISQLIKYSLENGLDGLEKWFGLPGTVGGAVRGNAGYNGLETKDILVKARIFDPKTNDFREVENNYFKFSYRDSKLKHSPEIIISATFKIGKGTLSKEEQLKIMSDSHQFRLKKQVIGFTTGSFFKNPSPDNPAGMLIDKVGLKGKSIGEAQISEKHANFFINTGKAAASDILALAKLAKQKVKEKFNIELQEEVQIFSEQGPSKL